VKESFCELKINLRSDWAGGKHNRATRKDRAEVIHLGCESWSQRGMADSNRRGCPILERSGRVGDGLGAHSRSSTQSVNLFQISPPA